MLGDKVYWIVKGVNSFLLWDFIEFVFDFDVMVLVMIFVNVGLIVYDCNGKGGGYICFC